MPVKSSRRPVNQCIWAPPVFLVCWRMPRRALLASRLFATCCGLISVGHGLSHICFGQVCKGLLVFGAAECNTLPLELFVRQSGLFRLIDHIRWLLARLRCPMKCISGGTSRFSIRSIVFSAWEHFWSLWLLGSLYFGLDCLIWPTLVPGHAHEKGRPKVCRCVFRCGA